MSILHDCLKTTAAYDQPTAGHIATSTSLFDIPAPGA
jgi:hypothetical protein